MKLFRNSLIETFILMGSLALLMLCLDDYLIAVFLNNASLVESSSVAVWTLDILCISAPFLGLKTVCGAVFMDIPNARKDMFATLFWTAVRTAVLVIALWYDFPMLIYLILAERISIGILSVVKTRSYILSKGAPASPGHTTGA